jgi:FK506-binding nuclear protein
MAPDGLEYLEDGDSDEESDELDDIADPRITEMESEEEEAEPPKLVKVDKKGKNKRPAEDEAGGLDGMISKDIKADEAKGSKQQKKLKNNKGEAVAVAEESKPSKSDKKVQFAKNLEQGPTGSTEKVKATGKPLSGIKVVQGVTVDDRKVGTGRAVKNGDTVGVRYIGKLADGKVFDCKSTSLFATSWPHEIGTNFVQQTRRASRFLSRLAKARSSRAGMSEFSA